MTLEVPAKQRWWVVVSKTSSPDGGVFSVYSDPTECWRALWAPGGTMHIIVYADTPEVALAIGRKEYARHVAAGTVGKGTLKEVYDGDDA